MINYHEKPLWADFSLEIFQKNEAKILKVQTELIQALSIAV